MTINLRDRNSEKKSALLSPVTIGHTAHPVPPPHPAGETPPHSLSPSAECSAVPAFGPPLLDFSQVWAGNWQCVIAARGITTQMCVFTSRHFFTALSPQPPPGPPASPHSPPRALLPALFTLRRSVTETKKCKCRHSQNKEQ